MDKSEFSTPLSAVVAVTGLGVALAVAAVAVPLDAPGRLLVGLAAAGLLGLAAMAWRSRPRLTITANGLVIGRFFGPLVLSREDILQVRLHQYPRLGRRIPMLEIDAHVSGAERLFIFGRWDLGTHPQDVYDAWIETGAG